MRDIITRDTCPVCAAEAVVQGEKYRISVLTPWLLRLEYNENGEFEDRPTQCVWNRRFPAVEYQVFETETSLKLVTEGVQLIYDKQKFSKNGLSLQVRGNVSAYHSIWHYGEEATDLKGTARTLDLADGAVELEHGVISRNGFAVLDDSRSLLLREDGWVEPRSGEVIDLYFFGYGHAYEACLRDFYCLTGNMPMLPRYALGNWWSRFYRYSEEEYKEVVRRFEREQVPFSVSVLDMDWHLVDIDPKYGSGWTGYTWNRELFPEPEKFMDWLHRHHLKVTLNVHPADGVRPFEEAYREMAEDLGKDWEHEEFIEFDITDPRFLQAYFRYLHHPNEEKGVDFWWIDWQQGGQSRIPGLDPLWMLNHYHYMDSRKNGKRGLIFSRYAGPGSHRYPAGFSGDTIISWKSLDFQPYFTVNASNIGYGWWSHDIGGHMQGYKDDELATRWVQFGVFSPITRLHSSDNPFTGKEPWNYNQISEQVMKRYLRLRHALVPYLYTMNYYASRKGQPLLRPLYYLEPEQPETYEVPNEYYFGTELLVCPITKPISKHAGAASFEAWLPEGVWFDIFNGRIYDGGRKLILYRGIEDIPVLARAGGILPMADLEKYSNSIENPESMIIKVFPGADGDFELYEDDGISADADKMNKAAVTEMKWRESGQRSFTVSPLKGNRSVVPEKRWYTLEFYGAGQEPPRIFVNGKEVDGNSSYQKERKILTVKIPAVSPEDTLEVRFEKQCQIPSNDIVDQIFQILYKAEMEYDKKKQIYDYVRKGKNVSEMVGILQTLELDQQIFGMLLEVLLAQVRH